MPRPKNKDELILLCGKNFEKLNAFIASFSQEEQEKEFPKGTMNRNIRDVLGHLYHWHLLFLNWYTIGMKGEKPIMPAEGYSWKMTPQLNQKIQEEYSTTPLLQIQEKLHDSHTQIQAIIAQHSNEELFEKQHYKWTGSTSLGAYLISATSSHYEWAYKLIRRVKQ